jgi:hypothetical protein
MYADYITSASVPQAPDWGGDRDGFISQLQSIATSRFCHQNFFTMNLSSVESVHTDTVRASRSKGPSSPTSTGFGFGISLFFHGRNFLVIDCLFYYICIF